MIDHRAGWRDQLRQLEALLTEDPEAGVASLRGWVGRRESVREYVKINTIWMRDERGRIVDGEYATPELEFLASAEWEWTEKVDGTNVRVGWNGASGERSFGGRTDDAQLSTKLFAALTATFPEQALREVFGDSEAVLYGEGYGAGIQKGGGSYSPFQTFVLFDVTVGQWWLRREDVHDVAAKLGLRVVPVVGRGTLRWASDAVRDGGSEMRSAWGDFPMEGLVGRPAVDLFDRKGDRIMAKIKAKDFRRLKS